MARAPYLRPFGPLPPQIFETQDPTKRRRLPSPGPDPSVPGVLGQDPRELMQRTFTEGLGEAGRESIRSETPQPKPPGLGQRLLSALDVAGTYGDLPTNSENDVVSGISSFTRSFAAARAAPGLMSAQQQRQQDLASSRAAQTDLRRAQAEYYRAQAARPATTGQGRRPLSEELELEAARQRGRVDIETLREGGRNTRSQRIQDRLRRAGAGTTPSTGKVSAADRLIEQRYRSAVGRGESAVQAERGRRASAYSTQLPLTPAEEEQLRSRTRHAVSPSFSADSAAVVNRINPQLLGEPAPLPLGPPAQQPGRGGVPLRDRLRGAATAPPAVGADIEPMNRAVLPDETDEQELSPEEIEGALAQVNDLDEEGAAEELRSIGYTPSQVALIMASR